MVARYLKGYTILEHYIWGVENPCHNLICSDFPNAKKMRKKVCQILVASPLKCTECARDPDLYELVSCSKFVNEILFCVICKTLYLTWGHPALGVILWLCLNFFELSTAELFFQS